MFPYSTDPATVDVQDAADRLLEDAREQDWAAFIQAVKAYKRDVRRWSLLVADVADAMADCSAEGFGELCVNFAEIEGWDGVLRAVARAMAEEKGVNR